MQVVWSLKAPLVAATATNIGTRTHKVAELQGTTILTGCGLELPQYGSSTANYPTCQRCARKV